MQTRTDDAVDDLSRIKKNISRSFRDFEKNNKRFRNVYRFVFKSNLSNNDEDALTALNKPIIECNIVNAFVSRLLGEYSKQEPAISFRKASDTANVDPMLLEFLEGHFRHILYEAKKKNTQYMTYKDQLAGGFSSLKVVADYKNEKSFDMQLSFKKTHDATLTGYDPMAREMDKSDAAYSFDLYPMSRDEFKAQYPDEDITDLGFVSEEGEFNWTYEDGNEKIIVLADYYEKKYKSVEIYELADKQVMNKKQYEQFLEEWQQKDTIAPPPTIARKRKTKETTICRYVLIKDRILEEEITEFTDLPHVFADGDSAILCDDDGGVSKFHQFTKPYVFHGIGTQRLKNLALQALGNDLETMVMHKFMIAKESIPDEKEFRDALINPQIAQTLVYDAYDKFDTNKALPPPREINRVPAPPEVMGTLSVTDNIMQMVLGSFDAALGINDNQLSGVAIVEAATQSNAAAMPYIVGHMQALKRVAQIIVKMIPKYYVTPTSVPVVDKEGRRFFVPINQTGGLDMKFDPIDIQVEVEADVSYEIQKNKALGQMTTLMQASPIFAQFMNEEGLPELLDNMDFRGIDALKEKAKVWMQQLKQRMAQSAQQPNPQMIAAQARMAQVQQKGQADQVNSVLDAKRIEVEQQKVDNDRIALVMEAGRSQAEIVSQMKKSEAEEDRTRAELAMKAIDMKHNHEMDKKEKENAV